MNGSMNRMRLLRDEAELYNKGSFLHRSSAAAAAKVNQALILKCALNLCSPVLF